MNLTWLYSVYLVGFGGDAQIHGVAETGLLHYEAVAGNNLARDADQIFLLMNLSLSPGLKLFDVSGRKKMAAT